jgi:glycosyltransferase involved in cell wall biosynthesis
MRILFCNYEYPPLGGGGGVINALLAQELAKQHEVTVLTSLGQSVPAESLERGVRVLRVPIFVRRQEANASLHSMLAFIIMGSKAGRELLRTQRFDLINTHFVLPTGPVGDILARAAGIPNVLTVHAGDLYDPSKFTSPHRHPLLRAWIRRLLRRSDLVVGQSRNTLDNMRRFYTPEIEGVRIPLGIQKPQVEIGSRRSYGFAENEILCVTVARLVARKALHQLIAMMDALRKEKVRLLIIGTGPQEHRLKEEARQRGLENRICFMGHVEESEKFRLLKMCDLYISTSQHEGFGLVFLEAMACALPIVCYSHGGQTDFLEDTITGYLLPLNDLAGFLDACRRLMKDRALRLRIGQENVRRVGELFIDRCARRYEEIFQEAITRSRMEAIVSLSAMKKLPLRVAEARLAAAGDGENLTAALWPSRSARSQA